MGAYNELAVSAAKAIADTPGEVYNPFFLYGNVGLGKTHLMQAIGNKIMESFPDKVVLYLPTSSFIDKIIDGVRN
jgi:chromosomal replication initiator protein